jgi:hypothetical protein
MPATDRRLTLPQAAARLQYSVRFLKSRLAAHNIAPIGRGRAARITEDDFKLFEQRERAPCGSNTSQQASEERPSTSAGVMPPGRSRSLQDRELALALRRSLKNSSRSGRVVAFPAGEKR